jgi:hypothetical protein
MNNPENAPSGKPEELTEEQKKEAQAWKDIATGLEAGKKADPDDLRGEGSRSKETQFKGKATVKADADDLRDAARGR